MERAAFSVVMPTFNEAPGIMSSLRDLREHVETLRERYDIELTIVDDGSTDETVQLVRQFCEHHPNEFSLVVHERNAGLVSAMRTGAEHSHHGTIVFLDADLSYRPEILEPLVLACRESKAAAALASPYMVGGHVANVPFSRLVASRGANWLLARCAAGRLHTFTGMVRAYDREKFLELFTMRPEGEFNAWAVAMFLKAGNRVVEIPADLVWPLTRSASPGRLSAKKLWERTWLVATTASVLSSAMRLGARSADLGPLVLTAPTNRPYSSDP